MFLADVHSHILYGVDDGAKNKSVMLKMLDNAYANGVRTICVTPHYNPELFEYNPKGEEKAYNELLEYSKEKYPDLRLCRWNEVYVFSGVPSFLIENKREFVAGSNNVLIEFSVSVTFQDIADTVHGMTSLGYKSVLAHVERYKNITKKNVAQLKQLGAIITVNAESVMGYNGWSTARFVKGLIKRGAVNIVSSDAHAPEAYSCFSEAYKLILKKYGEAVAEPLFWSNANNLFIKETE